MSADFIERFRSLQKYVNWTDDDLVRLPLIEQVLRPFHRDLVDDFYSTLAANPETLKTIVGGTEQIERLKVSLLIWMEELLSGKYDADYLLARSRVGRKHVEIGVPQIYVNVAMCRLRQKMTRELIGHLEPEDCADHLATLVKLLDLDLAIISDAYESEYLRRQQIAERVRLEAILHHEREFAEGLIQHAPAIVLVLDTQANVVRINPYTEKITGYSAEELCGENWIDVCIPEDERERIHDIFERTLGDDETSGTTNPIVTREGGLRLISWSNQSLRDQHGRIIAVLAVGQDISDVAESQQRALQAERLAAIGMMSTGLAHESRNALQRIQASTELLEMEVEDNPSALELVSQIQAAEDHLQTLLDEVRGYAAPVRLDLMNTSLDRVWREAWALLERSWHGRDVILREDYEQANLSVMIDHFRVVQVFRNILENALDACPDPVVITIACCDHQLGDQSALRLEISDNGPGFPEGAAEKVFEPFFTTKSKGTGLGMAIAQRSVEAHGGELKLANSQDGGATFILVLPRVVDQHSPETSN